MTTNSKSAPRPTEVRAQLREKRRSEALRDNLRRRKQQARGRAEPEGAVCPGDAPPAERS
ncbi:MAG: hypothetical protein EXQ85_05705 [Alphaproteobacteria bacterium]|nr:hypothetical protein [Alphaproteobacteria bacterium]